MSATYRVLIADKIAADGLALRTTPASSWSPGLDSACPTWPGRSPRWTP